MQACLGFIQRILQTYKHLLVHTFQLIYSQAFFRCDMHLPTCSGLSSEYKEKMISSRIICFTWNFSLIFSQKSILHFLFLLNSGSHSNSKYIFLWYHDICFFGNFSHFPTSFLVYDLDFVLNREVIALLFLDMTDSF